MLEFVLNTIFWTLAFYGFFELIKNILYISTYTKLKADGIYLILAVKNQEDKIECVLRSVIFKTLQGKEENIKEIIIADLKSKDKTKEIAKKMEKDYEILKVLTWKECKDLFDNIDESQQYYLMNSSIYDKLKKIKTKEQLDWKSKEKLKI